MNGHEILAEEQVIDLGVSFSRGDYQVQAGGFNERGAVVILDAGAYGNTCPGMFRILMMRFGKPPLLTDRFGNCSELPEVSTAGGSCGCASPASTPTGSRGSPASASRPTSCTNIAERRW